LYIVRNLGRPTVVRQSFIKQGKGKIELSCESDKISVMKNKFDRPIDAVVWES